METQLITLIDLLDSSLSSGSGVIQWGSPIPSFGDLSTSKVATLGLNPSNREFLDSDGNELKGKNRRFYSLNSLGIDSWTEIDARHIFLITESCRGYFQNNPYDRWFRILDMVVSGTGASFYSKTSTACHLDLIPFATLYKWNDLSKDQREKLLSFMGNILGNLLRDSQIKVIILNGQSVINIFQKITNIELDKQKMEAWSLPRHTQQDVEGVAYQGIIDKVSNTSLDRKILVLGFNHNLQSSFGVTKKVLLEIRKWVFMSSKEYIS